MQQVVVELHPARRDQAQQRQPHDDRRGRPRPAQPHILEPRARIDFDGILLFQHRTQLMIQHVLAAAQHQGRQQRHHRDQRDQQAAAADDAHLLDAQKVRPGHREERPRRRERPCEDAHARVHDGLLHRHLFAAAVAQFLLVARDEMHPEVNRQPDQDRHEGDGENVQVPHRQRGEAHRVGDAHQQAERRLQRPSRRVIPIDEDQRHRDQRQHRRLRRVLLRLIHLIHLQHRLARHAHVQARHLRLRFRDQFAEALHRVRPLGFRRGLRRRQVNAPVAERDVLRLLRLPAAIEQRVDPGRRRHARSIQARRRLIKNPLQRRQRPHQRQVLGIRLLARRADLRVHQIHQRHQVRRAGELLKERLEINQRLLHLPQVVVRHEEQRLAPQHLQVALVEDMREEVRLRLQLRA